MAGKKMCDKSKCDCRKKMAESTGKGGKKLRDLENNYRTFITKDGRSLLKKYLTQDVFESLKLRKTSYGSTLMDVVQSGLANPDSSIGIYAPDSEAYTVFSELFDPIIEEYHTGFSSDKMHPDLNWGDPDELGNLDVEGKYIVSTRVRCARSVQGYPLNPTMTEDHYRNLEKMVEDVLSSLEDNLAGTYHTLGGLDDKTKQQLIDDHFLFKEGDRFLEAANSNRYWPIGRGIFFNKEKTFLVWCNEEDHLRLISMEKGGNLASVYGRFVTALNEIGKKIQFSRHTRLGFVTFCPTNLGTAIRASVHITLPNLSKDYSKLESIADSYGLQVRGTRGEHSESEGGIYDISNKRRLGLSEKEALTEMKDGILEMIKEEKSLETL